MIEDKQVEEEFIPAPPPEEEEGICCCGKPLDDGGDHYSHMTQGY